MPRDPSYAAGVHSSGHVVALQQIHNPVIASARAEFEAAVLAGVRDALELVNNVISTHGGRRSPWITPSGTALGPTAVMAPVISALLFGLTKQIRCKIAPGEVTFTTGIVVAG
jgi:hypothetical protein